jgi:hypothetical protein
MYDLTKLKLNIEQLNGGSPNVRLMSMREQYEYIDGKRTDKKIGNAYDCILISGGFDKITIKILGEHAFSIPAEQLEANAQHGLDVTIAGFTAKPYRMSGSNNYGLSATATAITLLGKK